MFLARLKNWSVAAVMILAAISLTNTTTVAPAKAQSCSEDEIGEAVDSLAVKLKSTSKTGDVESKLHKLAVQKGLQGEDAEAEALALVEDAASRALDEKAATLLNKVNRLSEPGGNSSDNCERLAEINTTIAEIVEITASKSKYLSERLDGMLNSKTATAAPAPSPTVPPTPPSHRADTQAAAKAAPPATTPKSSDTHDHAVHKAPSQQARKRDDALALDPKWSAETERNRDVPQFEPVPDDANAAVFAALPPRASGLPDTEFTESDIFEAGNGLFGNISSGLAAVLQYAFKSYGQPNGYILGSEGGGAFLAGLRYGKGNYVTKFSGSSKIYWQGPSIGYDFGATGSRVMILVYNLDGAEDIYSRFAGVDGSAYVVGGAGITFLRKGNLVLAPIRTGLGLRVGANVGYLKFTPDVSINPF